MREDAGAPSTAWPTPRPCAEACLRGCTWGTRSGGTLRVVGRPSPGSHASPHASAWQIVHPRPGHGAGSRVPPPPAGRFPCSTLPPAWTSVPPPPPAHRGAVGGPRSAANRQYHPRPPGAGGGRVSGRGGEDRMSETESWPSTEGGDRGSTLQGGTVRKALPQQGRASDRGQGDRSQSLSHPRGVTAGLVGGTIPPIPEVRTGQPTPHGRAVG